MMQRSNINHELKKIDIEFRMLELEKKRHELERQLEEQSLDEQLHKQTTPVIATAATEPVSTNPAAKPSAESTAMAKPVAAKPVAAKPVTTNPTAKSAATKPSAESTYQGHVYIDTVYGFAESEFPVLGATAKPVAEKLAAEKPATAKPAAEKPAAEKPATAKPAAEKPAAEKPATAKPAAEKPATAKPAAEKPATAKPASEETNWATLMEDEGDCDMTSEELTSESNSVIPSSFNTYKMEPAPYVLKEFDCWYKYECYNASCIRSHPDPRVAPRCPYKEKCINMYWGMQCKDYKYVCRFNHTLEDIEKNKSAVICNHPNCDQSKCIFIHLDEIAGKEQEKCKYGARCQSLYRGECNRPHSEKEKMENSLAVICSRRECDIDRCGFVHNYCLRGKHCTDLLHDKCNKSHSAWEKKNIKENCRCIDGDKCPKYRNKNGNTCIWYH